MTTVEKTHTSQRAPWAKARILETATALFYAEGIRLVGVDRLISASQVTKATFYKHYRSKDNLVVAYVANRHKSDVENMENLIRTSARPRDAINAIVDDIVAQLQSPGFRGCLFLNAAAEYPDASHPIRVLVSEHRDWYSAVIQQLLTDIGHPLPGEGSDDFVAARDGAMTGGYAGDPIAAVGALHRAVDHVLSAVKN